MHPRTLKVLEFDKILEKLGEHCAFSGGRDIVNALLPSDDIQTVQERLEQTDEAYRLLEQKQDIHFGGVRDMRPYLERVGRGAILLPQDLGETKTTLMRARTLRTLLVRLEYSFSRLADMAYQMEPCDHVINEIARCINDRFDVVDNASPKLATIRHDLRIAQDRLLGILDKLVRSGDIQPYLQDALVTQRQGRYVIPVRSEYKGNIDGIVHDQSASGATIFIEPLRVVTQNNEVRELELQQDQEVRRILKELSELVADEAIYIERNIQILARLDFTFAKAKYAQRLEAIMPEIVPFNRPSKIKPTEPHPEEDSRPPHNQQQKSKKDKSKEVPPTIHPGSVFDIREARHPLLDPKQVVPINVYWDDDTFMLIITGPNTGGKTVTLKTVGLLALMAQSGMMIPVDVDSKVCVFDGIYSDIGDEQSIEQNLSTFSSHMTHIIEILEEANDRSLVLFDELGAGTDPDEGSALAMALLEELRGRSITTLATTHYSDLKLYAHNTLGVRNASVEFDVETLRPTYELSIGLPGRSNALTIARRLGLMEPIVKKAESIVRPDTLEAESLLDDIKRAKQEAYQARVRASERERQSQLVEKDLRYQLANIEEARRAVIAETRELMQAELEQTRNELARMRRQLSRNPNRGKGADADSTKSGGKSSGETHEAFILRAEQELRRRQRGHEDDDELKRDVILPGETEDQLAGPIEVGDRVWVASLQASGEVLALHPQNEEADVKLGNFRLKLALKRLELRQKAVKEDTKRSAISNVKFQSSGGGDDSPGMELDLRGERAESALDRVETYLDRAYRARLPWVRIIHGKGTGVLRDAVRNVLKNHPLIGSHRSGEAGEGGDGVTVAKLIES
ncbi:MAG: Smr/MutS family protein [Chloroflexota bacterium]